MNPRHIRKWALSILTASSLLVAASTSYAESKIKQPVATKPAPTRPAPTPVKPAPAPIKPAPAPIKPAPSPIRPGPRPSPTQKRTETVAQATSRTQSNSYVVNPSTPTARYTGAANPGAIDQLYKMTSPVGSTGQFDSSRSTGGGSTINTRVNAAPVGGNSGNKKAEPKK